MGAGLDLRPAQAEFQEGDPLGDGGVAPRLLAGLLQFLAQPGQRLGVNAAVAFAFLAAASSISASSPSKYRRTDLAAGPKPAWQ